MENLFIFLTDQSGLAAYLLIFGVLIACGLGLPLPEDIPLVAAGYLIWEGSFGWASSIAVTLSGVLIGDSVLFFIGRKLGPALLAHGGMKTFVKPKQMSRVRAYFRKYGEKIVFFARFVVGFRAATFFVAGTVGMPFRRFLFLDGLAGILSVPIWIGIGYLLGENFGSEIGSMLESLSHYKKTFTWVILAVVALVVVRIILKVRKAKIIVEE